MYLRILETNALKYMFDPAHFISAPGLAWQACFKKTGIKLELLTDVNMLLMVEKIIRGGYVMQYIDLQKQIINTKKTIIKIKIRHILCIYMQIIYINGQCLKNYL